MSLIVENLNLGENYLCDSSALQETVSDIVYIFKTFCSKGVYNVLQLPQLLCTQHIYSVHAYIFYLTICWHPVIFAVLVGY